MKDSHVVLHLRKMMISMLEMNRRIVMIGMWMVSISIFDITMGICAGVSETSSSMRVVFLLRWQIP